MRGDCPEETEDEMRETMSGDYEVVKRKYGEDPYEAQVAFCREHGLPVMVPAYGICTVCGDDVFRGRRGYGLGYAGSRLITSCPWCGKSFCD